MWAAPSIPVGFKAGNTAGLLQLTGAEGAVAHLGLCSMACTHLYFAYTTRLFRLLFQTLVSAPDRQPWLHPRAGQTSPAHTSPHTRTKVGQAHLSPDLLQPQLFQPRGLPERGSPGWPGRPKEPDAPLKEPPGSERGAKTTRGKTAGDLGAGGGGGGGGLPRCAA